jgi:hypothetical protein
MRCPDCNKFVAYDTEAEPEEQDSGTDGTVVKATVRRVLTCEQCSTELKEAELELEGTVSEDVGPCESDTECDYCKVAKELEEECPNCGADWSGGAEHDWELSAEYEPTTETVTKDRHGNPIKNSRYWKTMYGVEATFRLTCNKCGAETEVTATAAEQASAFNELV